MSHLPDPERQSEFYESVVTKRALAWVIDIILISLITTAVSVVTIVGVFFWFGLYFLISFAYRWITLSGGSATLGMRVMAIELRDAYGQRLSGGQAFLHTLGYFFSMSVFLVQIVSVIFMLTSERGQSLTDMVLGTTALNKRV